MDTTNSSENKQRRVEDRKQDATINWEVPGAPAVPVDAGRAVSASSGAAAAVFEGYDGETGTPIVKLLSGVQPGEKLYRADPAATSGDAPADLQQLKALALAATPGEWELQLVENGGIKHLCPADSDGMSILTVVHQDETPFGAVYNDADAHFIAAANPAVVLDLIARIERLKTSFELARANYEQVVEKNAELNARVELAASPATASGDELPPLSDSDYQSILQPVLSRHGMQRYLNGDYLELSPSDFRAIIDRARAAVSAATKPTADLSKLLADIEGIADELEANAMNHEGDFADTVKGCSEALRKLADAQSLLATKSAAAPAVPEGWKLVPVEPTDKMMDRA